MPKNKIKPEKLLILKALRHVVGFVLSKIFI